MSIDAGRARGRAALAATVLALLAVPWTPARVVAVFLAVGLLPGLAVASRARLGVDEALAVGAALSPVVFGALVVAAMFAGAGVHGAGWIATLAAAILFVSLGGRPREAATADRRALAGAALVWGIAGVLALALPLAETWWRVREDSWFHAAVADKLARDGLPPSDPYFAGFRLQYMYLYHAIVAACARLAGVDYFRAMILVNAVALASTVLAFHALAGQLTRRVGPRVLADCLWVFGMNGWFFLSYPLRFARAALGETRGLETLQQFFPWSPPGQVTAMALLSVEGNQFMFLDKFMVGTAFSLTFGLAALLLLLLAHARRGFWDGRHDVAFVLGVAGSLLLHLVSGLTLAVVTAAALAILLVVRVQPASGGPPYARLVAWIAVALAAAAPYLQSILPRAGRGASVAFAFQPSHAVGLLFDVLPALVVVVVFTRRARRDAVDVPGAPALAATGPGVAGLLWLWALLAATVALTVDLTTNNETKFAFFVFLPLAALSAGAFDRAWDSARRRAGAILLVVSAGIPLHALYFSHAVRESSVFEVSHAERAAYGWIRGHTPRDAVVVDNYDDVRVPVLASRDVYWGSEGYARNWGYPHDEMVARRRTRDAVFSDDGPSDAELARLRQAGRPVFVVYRLQPGDMMDAPAKFEHDRRFRGRFATREIAVWEITGDE